MSTNNALVLSNQEEPDQWRMPIEPSDYSDRTLALTEEERKGIEYLLSLTSGQYRECEQQTALLSRVTQPLFDVLTLYRPWRPKSQLARQYFLGYILSHVLQTNLLYWGWSPSL